MVTGIPLVLIIIAVLALIVIGCARLKWHPFLVLLGAAALTGLATRMDIETITTTITEGAGSVFSAIGIIIALGAILGEILERTHAARALAEAILKIFSKKRILSGMSTLGGIIGIPVFCDSGFIIMANLGKSLSRQSGVSFGAISIALATGLYTAHVLIPPTPGPLAVAGTLGASDQLGLVLLFGIITGIPAIIAGNVMAKWYLKREGTKEEPVEIHEELLDQVKTPGVLKASVPLFLPILLISMGTIVSVLDLNGISGTMVKFFSHPVIALFLGVLTAIFLLPVKGQICNWIGSALSQAGPIILITCAGGAFGAILKATPLSSYFEELMQGGNFSAMGFFPIVFLIASGLKTAQGSSTAAMVITSSIILPILPAAGMDTPTLKALLVTVIGAGAMAVSHANDSYFWVIQQYSKIRLPMMYRYFTLASLFMGIVVVIMAIMIERIFLN
jgi:GntP family gluconate:H+ symporter